MFSILKIMMHHTPTQSLTFINSFTHSKPQNHIRIQKKESQNTKIDLSDYYIHKPPIGNGLFGKVYLATHYATEKQYALKIISPSTKAKLKEAIEEMHVHSSLHHPNIIELIGYHLESQKVSLLMEYAEKGNLFQYIQRKRSLGEQEVRDIFMQVVNGIKYMHSNNYIHRDIKPENILLTGSVVKICDFGCTVKSDNPKVQAACGTFEYIAPEIIGHHNFTPSTDIWALGILLYEMLHGRAPFRSPENSILLSKILNDAPVYKKGLSLEVVQVLNGLLAKQPNKRWTLKALYDSKWIKQSFTSIKSEFHHTICNISCKNADQHMLKCTKLDLSSISSFSNCKMAGSIKVYCNPSKIGTLSARCHTSSIWDKVASLITEF